MNNFKKNIYKTVSTVVVSFAHNFSPTSSNVIATACTLGPFTMVLYSPEAVLVDITGTIVAVDQQLYTDADLTNLFNGGNFFYHYNSIESNGTAIRIASSGVMVESASCS